MSINDFNVHDKLVVHLWVSARLFFLNFIVAIISLFICVLFIALIGSDENRDITKIINVSFVFTATLSALCFSHANCSDEKSIKKKMSYKAGEDFILASCCFIFASIFNFYNSHDLVSIFSVGLSTKDGFIAYETWKEYFSSFLWLSVYLLLFSAVFLTYCATKNLIRSIVQYSKNSEGIS